MLSRAPLRRRAPLAWLARALARYFLAAAFASSARAPARMPIIETVAFVAGIFVKLGIGALEADHEGPRPGPGGRILHRDRPIDEIRADARIALDEPHVRGRAGKHRPGPAADLESIDVVRRFDDERVALPPSARHAVQLPHAMGRPRTAGHRHHPHVVNHLLKNGDGLGRLHDLNVAVVGGADARHAVGDAAFRERSIFRPVGGAARTALRPLYRRRLAGAGDALAPGRGQRRELAVRRIDDERRPVVPFPLRHPELVVVAGGRVVRVLIEFPGSLGGESQLDDVAEDRVAAVAGLARHDRLQLRHLGVGQELLVLPLSRPRHRRDAVVAPDALQIRLTVGRPRHLPALRGAVGRDLRQSRLRGKRGDRHRRRDHERDRMLHGITSTDGWRQLATTASVNQAAARRRGLGTGASGLAVATRSVSRRTTAGAGCETALVSGVAASTTRAQAA